MAVLLETDSFGLESLPCYIFNVLTYSFHGPGFMEAPPYRLPGQWLPTAPKALPNGKVKSYGKDTQKSLSAGGVDCYSSSCVPPEDPDRLQKGGGRELPPPRPPGLRGLPWAPLLSPKAPAGTTGGQRPCLAKLWPR